MKVLIVFFMIICTVGVAFGLSYICYHLARLAKLSLAVKRLKRDIRLFAKKWQKVEELFIINSEFREETLGNPEKMSSFLSITDRLYGTDFSKGLSREALAELFIANPELIAARTQEYLDYKRAKI